MHYGGYEDGGKWWWRSVVVEVVVAANAVEIEVVVGDGGW